MEQSHRPDRVDCHAEPVEDSSTKVFDFQIIYLSLQPPKIWAKKRVLFGAMGFLEEKPTDSRKSSRVNRSNLSVVRSYEVKTDDED